jgi:hypothetical protein
MSAIMPLRFSDRLALGVLRSRIHALLDRSLIGLRIRGTRSGRVFELPVMYAGAGENLVVAVAGSAGKRWWRNLRVPMPIDVLVAGRWIPATGWLVRQDDAEWPAASSGYFRRWPMARRLVSASDPIVRLDLTPAA